jgi:hypothetical protein
VSAAKTGRRPEGRGELENLIARIIDRINENPEKASVVLTEWVRSAPAAAAGTRPAARPLKKTG